MEIVIKPEIKYYKNQKPLENFSKQFLDDFFLPNEKSLLGLDENDNYIDLIDGKIKASNIKKEKIIWKRLSEIFGEDFAIYPSKENMHLTEIKQGDLGNCYLLSSLISLLQNPNLLLNIIDMELSSKEKGYYVINFFIDGEFQKVIIDDYFPINIKNGKLSFTKSNKETLWPILIEKAWAKVNGGYANIIGGISMDCFKTLTGFSSINFKNKNITDINKLFNIINESILLKCVLCSTSIEKKNEDDGILSNHCYSVLDCKKICDNYVLKLKNPWGYMKWKIGNFKEKSNFYEKKLGEELKNGIFYFELNDFKIYFEHTDICYVIENPFEKLFYINNNFIDLPHVFNLKIFEDNTNISLSINKKFWRFNRKMKNLNYPFTLLLIQIKNYKNFVYIKGDYESENDCEIFATLNKGTYFIYSFYDIKNSDKPLIQNYYLKILSNKQYKTVFQNFDNNFYLLKYILIYNIKSIYINQNNNENNNNNKNNNENIKEIVCRSSNDFENSGISYRIIINNSNNIIEIWNNSIKEIININLLYPNRNTKDYFKFCVHPKCIRIIFGIKQSKYGDFWFNLNSKIEKIDMNNLNKIKNNKKIFLEEKINDFDSNNFKNFIINNFNYIHTLYLKSNLIFNIKLNKDLVDNNYNFYFEKLLSFSNINSNDYKKIIYNNGIYIGQVKDNKKEGKGLFIYNDNNLLIKYSLGYYLNDKKNGYFQEFNYNSNLIFEGNYINNFKENLGIFYNNNNNKIIFNGIYKYNKKNYGIIFWDNNNNEKWRGFFENDLMNDEGIFYYKYNNKQYEIKIKYKNGKYIK